MGTDTEISLCSKTLDGCVGNLKQGSEVLDTSETKCDEKSDRTRFRMHLVGFRTEGPFICYEASCHF